MVCLYDDKLRRISYARDFGRVAEAAGDNHPAVPACEDTGNIFGEDALVGSEQPVPEQADLSPMRVSA